jgi:hypothetical protein
MSATKLKTIDLEERDLEERVLQRAQQSKAQLTLQTGQSWRLGRVSKKIIRK